MVIDIESLTHWIPIWRRAFDQNPSSQDLLLVFHPLLIFDRQLLAALKDGTSFDPSNALGASSARTSSQECGWISAKMANVCRV